MIILGQLLTAQGIAYALIISALGWKLPLHTIFTAALFEVYVSAAGCPVSVVGKNIIDSASCDTEIARPTIRVFVRNATLRNYADLADLLAAYDNVEIIESNEGTNHQSEPRAQLRGLALYRRHTRPKKVKPTGRPLRSPRTYESAVV
jgi:hypothetical protein